MKNYKQYMDRQEVSQTLHEKLIHLSTEGGPAVEKNSRGLQWKRWSALAACCALILGLGLWGLAPDAPAETPPDGAEDHASGQGSGSIPAEGSKLMFPALPFIDYQSADASLDMASDIAFPDGSFDRELTEAQIADILWGPEGRPETRDEKTGSGELPWMLFWDSYTLKGRATYDGQGRLFWLFVWGERPDGAEFTLELTPDRTPPTDIVEPGRAVTDVRGVSVTGWSRSYDRNGDDVTDYICGSEFVANGVGVRFENVGSPFSVDSGDGPDPMDAARQFNTLLVNWATYPDGGLTLDGLLTTGDVPDWRVERFSTLAQAREETEFAPYLPAADLPGYGEFFGRLEYQEERENFLFVRWSRDYDEVEVAVDRSGRVGYDLVDAANPASYDVRLYEPPWSESVPEQYRNTVSRPTFRGADMSLAVVEARARTFQDAGDSDGPRIDLQVLHPDGTLVSYYCRGLTAEQVWALVEETLTAKS